MTKNKIKIPDGSSRIHIYDYKNVLMPRGSKKKESIYNHILEKLKSYYESWTDPEYSDNPDISKLKSQLLVNLFRETSLAWDDFLEWIEEEKRNKT